jgi:L-methionine (R)-S-oxide reductase
MHEFIRIPSSDKIRFYDLLFKEIEPLLDSYWLTNLSNVSASLMAHMPDINWVGFYLKRENELCLGPFQGLPACLKIPMGKGVCGTAAAKRQTLLIADVETFPGHIACDARSRSEIVIPLIKDGILIGVLDVDSPIAGRFDSTDQKGLEKISKHLVEKTNWPTAF